MSTPTLSPQEAQDHAVFTALMRALSRPGEVQQLEAGGKRGLEAVGRVLLDLETSFYTTDPTLSQTFERLGARAETPDRAAYQFFAVMDQIALEAVSRATAGTLLYPDHGATVVVAAELGRGPKLRLRGPGINEASEIRVDLPRRFWSLREERVSFPLGWDVILISGEGKCFGLPRSTEVTEVGVI